MKVICAGLQKTGTKTIAEALRILGYNVHDVFDQFMLDRELWDKIVANTVTVEDYQRILGDVDAVMDWPAVAVWEQIMEAFPDAKVILMIRSSEDEWYKSLKNHCEIINKYVPSNETLQQFLFHVVSGRVASHFYKLETAFCSACLGIPRMYGSVLIETFLRSRYRQHNLYVKSTCPKEKLLIYNVKEGWEPLCRFLNKEIPDQAFPRENVKGDITRQMMKNNWKYDCGFQETMQKQMRIRLAKICFVIVAIISCLVYYWMI
ncbi:uncharacterized protein LOC120339496 [Styela clava]|uniref:uncharacterized protein LOC120339496 n=1 Tax=Styela clava TaxID=7725 RepID=UPI00193A14DE|nr:uncharacterized protein LOC120339496 [Styela clava]